MNYTARSLSVAGASAGRRDGEGAEGAGGREASGGLARTSVGASGSERSRRPARSYPIAGVARSRSPIVGDAPIVSRRSASERIAVRSIDDRCRGSTARCFHGIVRRRGYKRARTHAALAAYFGVSAIRAAAGGKCLSRGFAAKFTLYRGGARGDTYISSGLMSCQVYMSAAKITAGTERRVTQYLNSYF